MTKEKIQDWLIQLFFISVLIGSGISYSFVYLAHILAVPILYISLKQSNFDVKKLQIEGRWHWIFVIMIVWYALSVFWSYSPLLSLKYLAYILFGFFIVYSVVFFSNNLKNQQKILKTLFWVLLVELGVCFLEIFTSFRYPISQYSEYLEMFSRNADKIPRTFEELKYISFYPTGFHWNPNNLSVLFGLAFPFMLYSKNKYLKYFGSFIVFFIIIMASSRAVYIGLIVMLLIYLFLKSYKHLLVGLLILLCVQIFYYQINTANQNVFTQRLLETTDNSGISNFAVNKYKQIFSNNIESPEEDSSSLNIRLYLIKNGINQLIETKGLGVGGGASVVVQERELNEISDIRSMHNFWVEILVEGGVIFFLTFIIWYFFVSRKLYFISKQNIINEQLKYYAQSLFLGFCGFFITAISPSSVIYFFPMWLFFGLAISTILIYEKSKNEGSFTG
jgi:teichuronic acid biosynthesis protein TuaE